MKPRFLTRLGLAVGLIVWTSSFCPADILANGNFANGKASWKGDGKDAGGTSIDDISASMTTQGAASGMTVPLGPSMTYVSQVFHSAETALTLSITYKTSATFQASGAYRAGQSEGAPGQPPSRPRRDLGMMGGGMGGRMEAILGFRVQGRLPSPGGESAVVLIADPSQNAVISAAIPLPASPDSPHTSTVIIDQLMAHEEKTFYLFLPPGSGDVTFSNISLSKPGTAPASTDPFHS